MLIIIFLSIILLFSFHSSLGLPEPGRRYWPGWYPLILEPDAEVDIAVQQLADAGVTGVVAETNTFLSYMAIPELKRVSVDQLASVLVPGDPRRDPYISDLIRLFRSEDSPLIFLPDSVRLGRYRRFINQLPALENSRLADDNLRERLIGLLLTLAGGILVVTGSRRRVLAKSLSLLPWLLFVYASGLSFVVPTLLLFLFSPSGLFRNESNRSRLAITIGFTSALLLFLCYAIPAQWTLTMAVLPFMSLFLSELIVFYFDSGEQGAGKRTGKPHSSSSPKKRLKHRRWIKGKPEHRLFDPLPLVSPLPYTGGQSGSIRNNKSPTFRYFRMLPAAAVFIVVVFFIVSVSVKIDAPLPSIGAPLGEFGSFSSYQTLGDLPHNGLLPDVSMMLASRAFQEGFLYGSDFRVPLPGDSISLTEYRKNGDSIASDEQVMISFNQEWYSRFENEELSEGAGRLFAAAGGPAVVRTLNHRPVSPVIGNIRLRGLIVLVAALAAAYLKIHTVRSQFYVRNGGIPLSNIRRRAQAA